MALTLSQIKLNENIKSDRFGMAAISYIFRAFGDNIRSKEYWPWGKDVNFLWEDGLNSPYYLKKDSSLSLAIECISEAIYRLEIEQNNDEKLYSDISVKNFRKRLSELILNLKNNNIISDKINETSKETTDKLDELENYE